MHLKFRGVNDAFAGIVRRIHVGDIRVDVMPSRNGEVLVIPEPVIITYSNPRERVLLNPSRDANPFFHLFESLWMLAARNDVAPLAYYNGKIAQYSDDGKTFNGAYGYRWRHAEIYKDAADEGIDGYACHEIDQLKILIEHLRADPYSRRAVLQMWNVEDDLLKIDSSRDACCNLSVVFSVEQGDCKSCDGKGVSNEISHVNNLYGAVPALCQRCGGTPSDQPRYLNMTVFNRSNDGIWGALGANVVHFSLLQEYVACALGLDVGDYHQVSANLHVYTNNWKPEAWIADGEKFTEVGYPKLGPLLAQNREVFDREVKEFVAYNFDGQDCGVLAWKEPFLQTVAQPICNAFYWHKERLYSAAHSWLNDIQADDWRIAAENWINKREQTYKQKEAKGG